MSKVSVVENCQGLDQSLEKSTSDSRKETNKIEISDHKGVSVSCDFQYDLCTVTLAGWHHGEYSQLVSCIFLYLWSILTCMGVVFPLLLPIHLYKPRKWHSAFPVIIK